MVSYWFLVGKKGKYKGLGFGIGWTPHPVILTKRDSRDYTRDLLYSYYSTIIVWGVHTRNARYREYIGIIFP